MYQITLSIDGMACSMCESHVCDTIRSKFSVKKVTASHSKGEAVILSETQIPEAELKAALDEIFNNKDKTYTVINMKSMTDAMNLMTSMMTSLLVGIASIALVVGGIGIMNMMLVTVTERTTEIGLRKALGAEPGQIQVQFLIEAIILSLLGGVIGVVVGLGVSLAICMNTDITFSLNTFAIWLGVGFSAAVGIIFGWAPARKASRLNPIDALRSM